MKNLKAFALCLIFYIVSQTDSEFIGTFLCPKTWASHEENCWKSFNESDYCSAVETCRFYGSLMSNNTSNFAANVSSRLWVYDNMLVREPGNISCFTNENPALMFCPVKSSNGTLGNSNCTNNEQYACHSKHAESEMGLQNGRIKNSDLSASTIYESDREPIPFRPWFARLGQQYITGTTTQGGWCSRSNVSGNEYFEVSFKEPIFITAISVQGVNSRDCDYWLTLFNISYLSTLDVWLDYTSNGTAKTFTGNKNGNDVVNLTFPNPFFSQKLRVFPIDSDTSCVPRVKRFCLRMEVYGMNQGPNSGRKVTLKKGHFESTQKAISVIHTPPVQWPPSGYALPRPKSGCPRGIQWQYGYRLHDIKIQLDGNQSLYSVTNLANTVSSRFFVEEFCTMALKTERVKTSFPAGQYCIYMTDKECPLGFQTGSLRFYESSSNWNTSWSHTYGKSPRTYINYNASNVDCCFTEALYCCRNDTNYDIMEFPSSVPFYLVPITPSCPAVKGTQNSRENVSIEIDNIHFQLNKVAFGVHPYVHLSTAGLENVMHYFLCYYEPLVTSTSRIELMLDVKTRPLVINANYALDLRVFALFNDSLVQYGEFSVLSYRIQIAASCAVSPTQSHFNSSDGVALYSGSLCPSKDCGSPINGTLEINAMSERQIANTSASIKVLSKTNILIFVSNTTLQKWPSLENELLRLQTDLNTNFIGPNRSITLTLFGYRDTYDVIRKLREFKNREKSDPEMVHCIIAPNADNINVSLSSFAGTYDIPFLTGRTSAGGNDDAFNNVTLRIDTTETGRLEKALATLKRINITEVVVIRSSKVRIPPSLVFYFMKFKIMISKDLVISDQSSLSDVNKALLFLTKKRTNIYFITDEATTTNLFVSAVKLGISPKHGYIWISGSKTGTFEHGIGSRACYKLGPVSCGVAFKGAMILDGFSTLTSAPLASYVQGRTVSIDSASSQDHYSAINEVMFKDMILDSAESVKESIQVLTNRSETISTAKIIAMIEQRRLRRMIGLKFTSHQSSMAATNASSGCQLGWTGDNCSLPYCVDHHCLVGNGKCAGYETCECAPGFYGKDCSGICKNRCKRGICNDGALGDGTCLVCNWLYEGVYCDKASVLQALVASCLGSLMVVIIVTCYLLKVCRPRHSSLSVGDSDEAHWIVDWGSFNDFEQQYFDKDMIVRHLQEKMKLTYYYKARLRGENVFVTCWKKKPIKLSLDIRVEIRKVKKLDHINIEKVKAVCLGPPFVAIVTTLASMGSLYDTLHAENIDVPLEIKYAFMEDICRGMLFLHDTCGMTHGRLKSTNCLLHKGWRVKITDIGLPSLRKNLESNQGHVRKHGYYNQDANQQKQNTTPVDFNSLLWTAPEYLSPSIVNIDQIGHVRFEGDVYSFGILMAEILTRRPPYSEIKLMSIQHIIEAIAHLREPMVDLEVIRPGSPSARQDLLSQQAKIMRPRVNAHDLPKEEPGRSILKVLLDSAWSDDPDVRPPFSHIKSVLRIIAPLKGDQMEKRAFLLEKETETLEKYISYDTRLLSKEREKAEDWLSRSVPTDIYTRISDGEQIDALKLECVSAASFQIENFQEIITGSDPDELAGLLDYVFKSFTAIATKLAMEITDVDMMSNSFIVVSDGRSQDVQADSMVIYCLTVLKRLKNLELIYNPSLSLRFRVAAHCGDGLAGIIGDSSETLRYKVFGDVVKAAIRLSKMSKPNCLLISETCARLVEKSKKLSLVQRSGTFVESGLSLKTYWVIAAQ